MLICSCIQGAQGQKTPLRGVVWDASDPPTVEDLIDIREAGVEALQLPILEDISIVQAADTMGITLFQDLPVLLLPTSPLLDTLEYAKRQLSQAQWMHLLYPSAHYYGVSSKSDTSNPLSCEYFEALAQSAPDLTLYYTSAFVAEDKCSSHVDLVLIDTRRTTVPTEIIDEWQSSTPIGFTRFGKKVNPESYGLFNEFSPESQGRFLEDHLPDLLESDLEVIFIYRWKDDLEASIQWGLIDPSGQKRPAYEVLRGIYTESQNVFTFNFGEPPEQSVPWPLLMGWMSIFLTLLVCIWYRRFPEVMMNYVLNKYPHRETLYRESAILGGASFGYVIAQGVLISAVVLILIEAFRDLGMIEAIAILLSPQIIDRSVSLTSNPFVPTLVVSAIYFTMILVSSILGAWGARQPGTRVPVEHFFVINVMNNTPLGLMLPLVLVSPDLNDQQMDIMGVTLACSWFLISIYCNFQSTRNFASLARSSLAKSATLGLFILPLLLILSVIILLWVPYTREYLVFWWHLSFKS
ncbi:MAG: hypothetical protein OXE59_05360 [Bacteroidetes bacterium]|nr:hypothetical protein [Bacteroidota bacterium]